MRTLLVLALLVAAEEKNDKAELKKFAGAWQLVCPLTPPSPPGGEGEE